MLEELVFGYLTHSGFSETARLAARDMMGGARQVQIYSHNIFDITRSVLSISMQPRRCTQIDTCGCSVARCQHLMWSRSSGGERSATALPLVKSTGTQQFVTQHLPA